MAKVWTVRAKRYMNSTIPEGYTIRVTTPSTIVDSNSLEKALRAAGVDVPWGCLSEEYWDWM